MRMKVEIGGDTWTIQLISNRSYIKKHNSKDTAGMTNLSKKTIDLNKSEYSEEILIHELAHAFLYYQSIQNLDLDRDGWEEVYCEFIGKHLRKITKIVELVEAEWGNSLSESAAKKK
ncbi:MAG: SprT-like domain-containing protein [Magnetococcus sp. WYHC-3]